MAVPLSESFEPIARSLLQGACQKEANVVFKAERRLYWPNFLIPSGTMQSSRWREECLIVCLEIGQCRTGRCAKGIQFGQESEGTFVRVS